MGKKLAEMLEQQNNNLFNAGMDTGEQFAADVFARAMYKNGVSKAKIIAITQDAMAEAKKYGGVFETRKKNTEADYLQEKLDGPLREIFGELYRPFKERYDYIKECVY